MSREEELPVHIRRYRPDDLETAYTLLHETVHTVNRRDYTAAQADAWAPAPESGRGRERRTRLGRRLTEHLSFVAVAESGALVGFGDIAADGFLDHLYVDVRFQRRGVGGALLAALETAARGERAAVITTDASLTIVPFLERRGYRVQRWQSVQLDGVTFLNARMEKRLAP